MKTRSQKRAQKANAVVTLKAVAAYVGLTPGTVSAVLNNSAAARSFPQHTKDRVLAAARKLNYRPNLLARALRVKRTYTIGVITEEIGDAYGGMVISGIEKYLRQHGYFFLTVAHRHDTKLLEDYSHLLLQRGVEGFITVDTSIRQPLSLPTVAVAGHQRIKGVTNLILNHRTAARIALEHLTSLGHEEIALMRGPATSSDSRDRWKAIIEVCGELGVRIRPEHTIQLAGDKVTPELGYPFAKRWLARQGAYTALFAYNDNCAIAAIRAIHEAGLRVPEDISVVGFDDIQSAAYAIPALTTVRQPLREMGEIAARTLLNRIESDQTYLPEIVIEPELVVRQSTAHAPGQIRQAGGSAVRG
jgi:LacI family transcriptional regulator